MTRSNARILFAIAAIVCAVFAFWFHAEGQTYDDGNIGGTAMFGIESSPWLVIHYNIRHDDGSIQDDLNVHPFTESGLILLIGIVCFVVYYKLREKPFFSENNDLSPIASIMKKGEA